MMNLATCRVSLGTESTAVPHFHDVTGTVNLEVVVLKEDDVLHRWHGALVRRLGGHHFAIDDRTTVDLLVVVEVGRHVRPD